MATVELGVSRAPALLFAVAGGLAVANISYAQPLLGLIAADLGMDHATVGLVTTITQAGYAVGLVLLVPLGDVVDRRRLIVVQLMLSALALGISGLAPTSATLLAGLAAVGVLAVVIQVLVASSADLVEPAERGRIVGVVTSGVVIGILLARTIAGVLADLAGWRSVYLVSAAATAGMTVVLLKALPSRPRPRPMLSYPRLISSVFRLIAEVPVLRDRALLALLGFAAFTTLLTPLALPLSAPRYNLSTTVIGLFGLAGVAGALGAAGSGRMADRGHAHRITGVALTVMLASWLPTALLPQTLWGLVVGIIAFDYGLQAVHVVNQALIYQVRPDARSRLTAAYMLFYSIGSALGAISSTLVYAHAGWSGVCVSGAVISLAALLSWSLQRRYA